MNIFIVIIGMLTFGFAIENTELNKQQNNCFAIENFNSVASYIAKYGKPIKLSERLLSDKELVALEVITYKRDILLEYYQDYKRIIIIDSSEEPKIPPYYVSNENNKIQVSAYYSRFDSEEDINKRASDWCDVVSVVTKK